MSKTMLRFLTDPTVTSQEILPQDWSVLQILDSIAGVHSGTSPYHALIDTGALITGMSNLEVARYLLERGLRGVDGVVYLFASDLDASMIDALGKHGTPRANLALSEANIKKLSLGLSRCTC